jgi:hypothetical protein
MKNSCAVLVGLADFKLHQSISFGKLSGEARDVNSDMITEWLNAVWPSVHEGFADSDIFNADETGIFFS